MNAMAVRSQVCLKTLLVLLSCLSLLSGCGLMVKKPSDQTPVITRIKPEALNKEERDELLREVGGNYVYGQGLGKTMLNVGSVVLFPPYAAYLLGNTVLEYSGYEPMEISSALPDTGRESWKQMYETVTSAPGRVVAAVAGEEYRNDVIAREKILKFAKQPSSSDDKSQAGSTSSGVKPEFYTPESKFRVP